MRGFVFFIAGLAWFGRNAETVDFDRDKTGVAPSGWTFPNTHRGDPGRWMSHPDATAPSKPNVFAQLTADKNRGHVAIALFDRGDCRDGDLSVNFKVVSGRNEQTAGMIWRYQDPNNYYAVLASAIDDKVTVYKVIGGKPAAIMQTAQTGQSTAVTRRIDPLEWNLLKVVFRDQRVAVFLNHRKLVEAEDSALTGSGKTGVWTKGDTVAYFDDFRIDRKK